MCCWYNTLRTELFYIWFWGRFMGIYYSCIRHRHQRWRHAGKVWVVLNLKMCVCVCHVSGFTFNSWDYQEEEYEPRCSSQLPRYLCFTSLPGNLWSEALGSCRHISDVTSPDGSDGATDQLWCHDITHVTAWSSATHSPTLSKTDDKGPPTPTDTPSAIAASARDVNTHSRTGGQTHTHTDMQTHLISKELLSRRIRSLPAKATVWTGEQRAQTDRQGGQMSWKWQGVITSQHLLRSLFTTALFLSGIKAQRFLLFPPSNLWVPTFRSTPTNKLERKQRSS